MMKQRRVLLRDDAKPHGKAFALVFDARLVSSYQDYVNLVGRRRTITKDLIHELLKEKTILQGVGNRNLIVAAGSALFANGFAFGASIQGLFSGVGSSNATPLSADTDLNSPIMPRVGVSSAYVSGNSTAVLDTFYGTSANAGTWNEEGVLTASTGGTMFLHALFASPIIKTNLVNTVVAENQVTF